MPVALHGPYLNWAKKYIASNLWRMELEFEDCLQEAQMKFIICQQKYGEQIEAPHLMSLFQQAVRNHFHTLSSKRTKTTRLKAAYIQKAKGNGHASPIPVELLEKGWQIRDEVLRTVYKMEQLLMSIKKELADACGCSGEDLEEILRKADDMSEEAFENLSAEAKQWINDAMDAANSGESLPPLAGGGSESKPKSGRQTKKSSGTVCGNAGRKPRFKNDDVIHVLKTENPRRNNSKAAYQFSLYEDGMTVEEFINKGGKRRNLRGDVRKGHIEINSPQ